MRKKVLIITTFCLAIAMCVAAIGLAFAWYTNRSSAENGMVLNADGVLVVYFEANEMNGNPIKPAVAKEHAITQNVTEFNVLDPNDPNIEKEATKAEFSSAFKYINGQSDDANVPCNVRINCEAFMTFDDGTKEKLSLVYDIAVKADITFTYIGGNGNDSEALFTEENFQWGNVVALSGNAHLSMEILVYLIQPDDLCTPRLLEASGITVAVTIAAESV